MHLSAVFLSESSDATTSMGAELGERLGAGDVVALEGGLGAGKTVFVRGVAAGLGLDPGAVTSPTFTLVHEYTGPGNRCPLFHLDLYRIESPEAVHALGWDEAVGGRGVAVVEWADRAVGWLPGERLDVGFVVTGETARRIGVAARGERAMAHLQALLGGLGWGSRRVPA